MTLGVLVAVTHLLGAGHLTRAAALARAFAARGHKVTLASGGSPQPLIRLDGVDLVQLPPVRTVGIDFRRLLDGAGKPVDEAYLAARRDRLLAALRTARPDVVLTELFPFGRRVLAAEFLGLVEAARAMRPRPLVACSLRDVLAAPGKPERVAETHARLERLYDLVLVHGDPDLVPLEASWPVGESVRRLLRYTGYVDEGEAVAKTARRSGILVSGGSSAASVPLYRAAIAAADRVREHAWHLLLGAGIEEAVFQEIRAAAPAHVEVERARRDFRALLGRAAVSVSQCGYNTVVDLLRAGPAAVVVPFEAGHETEQRLRAEQLGRRGLAVVLPEADLSAARLAEAVRTALAGTPPAPAVSLDGSARTVALIESHAARAPAVQARWDWSPLARAVDQARGAGFEPRFWWRDDDAIRDTPQLRRLLALRERHRAPLALAVVPKLLEESFARLLATQARCHALVHGYAHRNHAGGGEKKAEFGPQRPLDVLGPEAREALLSLRETLGPWLLPVFVPPWNRIAPSLVPDLPSLGFAGLSTFRDRQPERFARGLVEVNTHIDPIDWRGGRRALPPEVLISTAADAVRRRTSRKADRREAIGLLTHHLVHDEAVWRFCEALLEELARLGIGLADADVVFSDDNRIAVGL